MAIDCSVDSFDGKTKAAEVYAKQRIPKAQYLNLNQWVQKGNGGMIFKIPSEQQFTDQLKSMGVGKDSKVICYDNLDGTMASRGAFLLSAFGIKDVSILNGKFSTWCPESSEKLTTVEKADGASFEFKLDQSLISTEA